MKRILIVEDQHADRMRLIRRAAEAFPDAEITTAESIADLILLAGQSFDFALLDLKLPDSNSVLHSVNQCAEQFPGMPLIVVSALDKPEIAAELGGRPQGDVVGYFSKSVPEAWGRLTQSIKAAVETANHLQACRH